MLPLMDPTNLRKQTKRIASFGGLNLQEDIKDNEFSACTNISTRKYPFVTNNFARIVASPTGTGIPYGIYVDRSGAILGDRYLVSGPALYKNNVDITAAITSIAASNKSMVKYLGNLIIAPDKKYYDMTAGTGGAIATMPDIDYLTTNAGRMYGVSATSDTIYYSAFRLIDDWAGTGILGGGSISVEGEPFSGGITTYKGNVIAFTDSHMFQLYGEDSDNFDLVEVAKIGSKGHRGIREVNGALYWVAKEGIFEFTGDTPVLISYPLGIFSVSLSANNPIAGTDGRRYYVGIGDTQRIFVYDTYTRLWTQETLDAGHTVVEYGRNEGSGTMFILQSHSDGFKIEYVLLTSSASAGTWDATSKWFTEDTHAKKYNIRLKMHVNVGASATFKVYTRIDNAASLTLRKTITGTASAAFSNYIVNVPIARCNRFQYKVEGTKESILSLVEREYVVGGDI